MNGKADSPRAAGVWTVEWHAEIDSTMDRASSLAGSGSLSGHVVVADYQRRGRGTHGREWHAQPGTCLMFTILARPDVRPAELTEFPLKVATSVAEAVSSLTGMSVQVEEPNDLMICGKKLCGVLCTSRMIGETVEWVLCGIGLNTNMLPEALPVSGATSLQIESDGANFDHAELLGIILEHLRWLLDESGPSCAGYADKPILTYQVQ